MQESVSTQDNYQQGEEALVLRLLTRKFGIIEPEVEQRICSLSRSQLDDLSYMLFNFKDYTDFSNYLASIPNRDMNPLS
ncbi:DUF4351 domain-containing protein [Aetokthonos hydrillicola Thurmond2011]|jgi:hypothetical protein|uniref:DUF4351 domain-containing protein n=1 Tax=Aetokthonos hydrillicola Thurmond2011 TaxID=2712845 RepID=A0AAP5MBM2_9CYAN|nr:DUF4351 domain-containing protein [Aetokthonos hydrillicola]MBO3460770.1 DUF4351 domain-containing protein [Aetokthonos hydrillicola CCALA 1050]MBW4585367.1 DUF4351 domain-containing protein [Aetokthonos hydrillicola CCALA 1050]MDR9897288.1 DUF4351 domain-containing protein [Aetokthonos hydrillicola Thurmond2011]